MNDFSEQDNKAIVNLLVVHYYNELSPSSHDQLDEWVNESDANMMAFEDSTDCNELARGVQFLNGVNAHQNLLSIQAKLGFSHSKVVPIKTYRQGPLLRINRYAIVAAASVILLVLAGVTYFAATKKNNRTSAEKAVVQKTNRPPGSAKARLVLANGDTIIIEDAKEGQLVKEGSNTIIKNNGEISYQIDSDGHSSKTDPQNQLSFNTLSTPRGGSYHIQLPDGSHAWLNAGSSLTYPTTVSETQRRVTLDGEAYFEVVHATAANGDRIPFIVDIKGKNTKVEVLGTHFDINAYDNEPVIKATLLEGRIRISTPKGEAILKPNQQAEMDRGHIKVVSIDAKEALATQSWKDGKFVITRSNLSTVVRGMERWYDINIELATDESSTNNFVGTLSRKDSLATLLKILELNGIHSKAEKNKLVLKK